MPGKSLEMKASEKFHELSDNYFNTPAPPEPELVSIPNPKKHPLGTDATRGEQWSFLGAMGWYSFHPPEPMA